MSDTQVQPGGSPVPQNGGRVAGDQSSITGDGTAEHPLTATGAGGVVITNATLTGDGTVAVPLGINPGHVAVVADGTTITGNGTTGSPLISHSTGATVDTNATLTGDGSVGTPLGTVANKTAVLTDGTTITGTGVTGNALTAHPSVSVDENGTPVTALATVLNFVGSGVAVTDSGGGVAHISIPGGGGGGTVFTDATLTGDGSVGSPIGTVADMTAVLSDGTTIAGDGVTGTPLHTVAGGTAIVADGTSIAGTGVTGTPIHTVSGGTAVAVDGITITGDGTTGDPLTTSGGGAGGRTFLATLQTVGGDHIGQPVAISSAAPSFGITSVTKASGESTIAAAECAGLMIANSSGDVTVQYNGIVTLTTVQWDALVAGEVGGLTVGDTYYLAGAGQLIPSIIPDLGAFPTRVGIALNTTQMLLLLAPPPLNAVSALVRSNAYVTSKGFGALGHSAAGRYQLPLSGTPPADNNCIVTVTLSTNFSVAVSVAASVASGVVDIFISTEPGGAGIDGDFYAQVINNS